MVQSHQQADLCHAKALVNMSMMLSPVGTYSSFIFLSSTASVIK